MASQELHTHNPSVLRRSHTLAVQQTSSDQNWQCGLHHSIHKSTSNHSGLNGLQATTPVSFTRSQTQPHRTLHKTDTNAQPKTYFLSVHHDGINAQYYLKRAASDRALNHHSRSSKPPTAKKIWKLTGSSIVNPESTYYSAQSNALFVSNVVGDELTKDGQGWISKVSASGKILKSKWVEGLNAPHGMRAHDGTLWVADIDELVAIDMRSARVITKIPVPGAAFLNDVAISENGQVFVSDTLKNCVYRYTNGRITKFAQGRATESPNGLLAIGNTLIVAGWGHIQDPATFATDVPGHVFQFDLSTKQKTRITQTPLGNLDGIERGPSGNFLVSDYISKQVFSINPRSGEANPLISDLNSPSDIGFIRHEQIVVVPDLYQSRVTAYKLFR
ncbi:MAG TPA: hypothetical protein V6C78_18210 [Crinalium sp.]|jgi:hypothetical protein